MSEKESKISPVSRVLRRVGGPFVWEKALKRNHLEFSDESRSHLFEANERLKQSSVVLYINHTSQREDVELPLSMICTFLPNTEWIMGPVAVRHSSFSRDWKNASLLHVIQPFGIGIFPIVQPKEVDKQAILYSDEQRQQMSDDLKKATADAIQRKGTVIGIAPEGTRSENGTLLPARNGIGFLEQYDQEHSLSYMPVFIGLERYFQKPTITVGEPLRLDEMDIDMSMVSMDPKARAQSITHLHMQRLAHMMPEDMRGVWGSI